MLELITLVIFGFLMVKSVGLALKLTWGAAKVIASILMVLAMPLLVVCMLFVGGIALILPVAVIGIALIILNNCV